jgi:hypothetical protein
LTRRPVKASSFAVKSARWRRDNEVFVGGRNETKLARGVQRQVTTIDVWRAPALLSLAFDFGPPRRLAMKALSNVGVVFVRVVRAFSVDFT